MTTIEQLLGDLLVRHNCVIVPAFGGFVARKVSARIDYASGTMHPPSKSLLFNKQLINNDGLLIAELSQANGISFDQATAEVGQKVSEWNSALRLGHRIELDRIGYLYLDTEKNLCFEQDRFFNLLMESFGLGQVHFLTEEDVKIVEMHVVQERPIEPPVEEARATIVPMIPIEKEVQEEVEASSENIPAALPSRKKVWRYVAAACILPIAFYSVWIPMKTDVLESGIISLHDFNPFHTVQRSQYVQQDLEVPALQVKSEAPLEVQIGELSSDIDVYTYAFSETLNIPVVLDRNREVDVQETNEQSAETAGPTEAATVVQQSHTQASLDYIVGCFGQEANAKNLVAKLKSEGFTARIVDFQNGLHRVSAGAALSEEAMAKIKSSADAAGYSGWILK